MQSASARAYTRARKYEWSKYTVLQKKMSGVNIRALQKDVRCQLAPFSMSPCGNHSRFFPLGEYMHEYLDPWLLAGRALSLARVLRPPAVAGTVLQVPAACMHAPSHPPRCPSLCVAFVHGPATFRACAKSALCPNIIREAAFPPCLGD